MSDKVLLIGSGGREHAIAWKLSQSEHVGTIFVYPGSGAIDLVAKCRRTPDESGCKRRDFNAIGVWCLANKIDLVVIGPEDPLADGMVDVLSGKYGLHCFGPTAEAARIEADKSWSKEFMERHAIPTARFESFTSVVKAKAFIKSAPYKALVVKASGLASGKGVIVAKDKAEACAAVDTILGKKTFGSAGSTIVVEEKLIGEEISLLAFVDGTTVRPMLPAQDHKRIRDGDEGPNTGGMGAYCPCPLISDEELRQATAEVLQRAADGFKADGIRYSGVLYAGLMLTPDGPKTLEYNCRFGDPETQVLLPLLKSDLYVVMRACAEGRLAEHQLRWRHSVSAVGVVMASAGYPESATKGCTITGIEPDTANHHVFHSGTAFRDDGTIVTNGGRVLINVEVAASLPEAIAKALKQVDSSIRFKGAQYRTDIGHKGLKKFDSLTYKASGVDITAGDQMVQKIKPLAKRTHRKGVIGGLGGFGGLFRVKHLPAYSETRDGDIIDPYIVERTSGIGAKLRPALETERYHLIGHDLVANVVNDVLANGARPFAFLDYVACHQLKVNLLVDIVHGISDACVAAECSLLGGETAEMPALFPEGSYDLAGYCVGAMNLEDALDGDLADGDSIIALPASGLHCAGFAEIDAAMKRAAVTYRSKAPFGQTGKTFADELLVPTRIYGDQEVRQLFASKAIKRAIHVTAGGLERNVQELNLQDTGLTAELDANAAEWELPELYAWLLTAGGCTEQQLRKAFNFGIGMVLVCAANDLSWHQASGAFKIGQIRKRAAEDERSVVVPLLSQRLRSHAERHFPDTPITAEAPIAATATTLADTFTPSIRKQIAATHNGNVHSFKNGTRALRLLPDGYATYADPILVIGTDGIGSKILIAKHIQHYGTIGVDLVAMCVNDILCNGADALTFLDYFACGAAVPAAEARSVLDGVANGVRQSEASLIDGQTVELPTLYAPGEFDLAGFAMGVVDHAKLMPRSEEIVDGDVIIGLPSDGVHSNGFSLVHKVMEVARRKFTHRPAPFSANGASYGEELLRPTRIYTAAVKPLLHRQLIKTIAHITGGGLLENIPRALPDTMGVELDFDRINILPVFAWLSSVGNVSDVEMQRTFNCGIGLVLVVDAAKADVVLAELTPFGGQRIGHVFRRENDLDQAVRINAAQFAANIARVKSTLAPAPPKRVGVLISGNGSNLQALIEATRDSRCGTGAEIVCVISNKASAFGLERAKAARVKTEVLLYSNFTSRDEYDAAVTATLERYNVDIVCLAGYMRIVSVDFVKHWRGRVINIHPSLLPAFPGLHAQRQALEAKVEWTGCTVHFVDAGMDTGPVIRQRKVQVFADDTEETLTERVLVAEHLTYAEALRLVATGAVTIDGA